MRCLKHTGLVLGGTAALHILRVWGAVLFLYPSHAPPARARAFASGRPGRRNFYPPRAQLFYHRGMRCEQVRAFPNRPTFSPPPPLRLLRRPLSRELTALLPSGAELACDLREVEHPEGRFRRSDGTRYDVCLMDVLNHPNLRPPAISRANFIGDCADNQPAVIRLGNVRPSSFRLRLISPGHAFGTTAAQSKATNLAGA